MKITFCNGARIIIKRGFFDKAIEKIIIFLNKTILKGYRERQWNKLTAPIGEVVDWNEFDYFCEEE